MELSLILDMVVAVLLAATIAYAALLNRRLQGLRANRAEFEAMVTEFNEATRRAEGAIQALRLAADQTAKALSVQVERGQALRDKLAFLTNRADGAAERITSRAEPSPQAAPRPQPARSQPVPVAAAAPAARPIAAAPASAPRPAPAPVASVDDESDGEGGRSKAEQDLLKALRELR